MNYAIVGLSSFPATKTNDFCVWKFINQFLFRISSTLDIYDKKITLEKIVETIGYVNKFNPKYNLDLNFKLTNLSLHTGRIYHRPIDWNVLKQSIFYSI